MVFWISFSFLCLALLIGCRLFVKANRDFYRTLYGSSNVDTANSIADNSMTELVEHSSDSAKRISSDFDDITESLRESSNGLEKLLEGQKEIKAKTDEMAVLIADRASKQR